MPFDDLEPNFFAQQTANRTRWSGRRDILLVDAGPLTSWYNMRQLAALGLPFARVTNLPEAIVRARMPGTLAGMIVDYDTILDEIDQLSEVRRLSPRIPIVGTSLKDRWDEFAVLGVLDYLEQPWKTEELLAVLPEQALLQHP
jgi:hypothetical protein